MENVFRAASSNAESNDRKHRRFFSRQASGIIIGSRGPLDKQDCCSQISFLFKLLPAFSGRLHESRSSREKCRKNRSAINKTRLTSLSRRSLIFVGALQTFLADLTILFWNLILAGSTYPRDSEGIMEHNSCRSNTRSL